MTGKVNEKSVDTIVEAVRSITAADYTRVLSNSSQRTAASPLALAFVAQISPRPERIAAHYAAVAAARTQPPKP